MTIPEVSQVFGKAGRAETATDPAPLEMFETVVNLKPDNSPSYTDRLLAWLKLKDLPKPNWRKGMDIDTLKNEINDVLTIPGVSNTITMPIKARIDMNATGMKTNVGVKVIGPKLEEIEKISKQVEEAIKDIPGTRSTYAERVGTGYFLDIIPKREEIARYGLSINDVQDVVQTSLGGMNVTIDSRGQGTLSGECKVYERAQKRYREDKEDTRAGHAFKRAVRVWEVPVQAEARGRIPLGEIADIVIVKGPTAIKSEEGLLANYVYVDYSGGDLGGYVESAKKKVASAVKLPVGYRLLWSGEYEYIVKMHERLKTVIPLTLVIIFVLLYFNTKSVMKTVIVLLAVPFSLVGSFWLLYLLNYNMSIAVWVGMIALAGLDAETGVVMLLYLDLAYEQWKREGRMNTVEDLKDSIMHGAVKRIRPKLMTVGVILAGLIPIMFSHGTGSDVMKRIAAPMIGGVITSEILELTIYPAIYLLWKGRKFKAKAIE